MPTYASYVEIKAVLDANAGVFASLSDAEAADYMNDSANGGTVDRKSVSAAELQAAVDYTEWNALTTNEHLEWLTIISAQTLLLNLTTKAQILGIWPPAGNTRASLATLQTKIGTFAEVQWGDGAVVTLHDVHVARRQP